MNNIPAIGDQVTVEVATIHGFEGFTGRVKFATADFLSVDRGQGVVAILRRDENVNAWRMGKLPAVFTVDRAAGFGDLMAKTYKLAMEVLAEVA